MITVFVTRTNEAVHVNHLGLDPFTTELLMLCGLRWPCNEDRRNYLTLLLMVLPSYPDQPQLFQHLHGTRLGGHNHAANPIPTPIPNTNVQPWRGN